MTRQTSNPQNTQQMDEAAMRELVANIRDQLAQLSDRMDVSEARLKEQMAASEARAEERRQMQILTRQLTNLSVQQTNHSVQRTIPSLQRMNPSLEQWNLDLQRQRNMAQAQQQRRAALNINLDRRAQNTVALHGHRLMATATPGRLAPLVSLSTGREIEGFPATFDDIAQINENDARRILADLEVATDGLSTAEMRDKIRSQVHYG